MSEFVHLYLGHLFGDYVLQNSWIAVNKPKKLSALTLHVFLIFLSQLFFILPKDASFLWRSLLIAASIAAVHFVIDYVKGKVSTGSWFGYLVDQLLHLIVILAFVPFVLDEDFILPGWISVRLVISIFNAYFISILFHFVFDEGAYKRDWMGYIYRFSLPWLFGLYYWIFSILGFVALHLPVLKNHMRKSRVISNVAALILTTIWEVLT